MGFSHDRRGQSVVVGTVILFGFLILALASYQAFAVPAQNNAAEFEHSQDVQSNMQDLRASLLDIRDARENRYQRPVRVGIGFRYDSRLFAVNPPPPEGALTTQDRGDLSISGANVVNDQDFDNTEPLFDRDHPTRLLTYRPNYNEYRNPPRTTFEHSLLYNRFEGANRTVTGQRTVDGDDRQLSLVTYSNDINRQGLSTTIDPETIDGATPTIPIEGENGDQFTVTLPTHSPSVWTDLIGNTTETGEPNARVVDSTAQSVTVELNGRWYLQMARVGYEGRPVAETPFSNVTREESETNVTDVVLGPSVTDTLVNPNEVSQGEELDVLATVSSVGNEDVVRSGTPIQTVRVTVGNDEAGTVYDEVFTFDPDDSRELTFESSIQVGNWDPGTYDVTVSGQDASGRWTAEDEVGMTTVTVREGDPPGSVNFVATDVAEGGNSQEFVFTVDGLGNNDQATIDLSGPQSDGVDYTNGAVELIERINPDDAVSYDPSTNTITYTKRGGDPGEVRIRISNIDVTGNAGDTYLVEYADDDGNADSDTFEIRPSGTTIVTQDTDEVSANSNIVIEDNVVIDGDVNSQNGEVTVGDNAEIDDDVSANGNIVIGDGAFVDGDVDSQNGRVTLEDGSEVEGDVNVNSASDIVCGQGSRIDGQPCEEYVDENY